MKNCGIKAGDRVVARTEGLYRKGSLPDIVDGLHGTVVGVSQFSNLGLFWAEVWFDMHCHEISLALPVWELDPVAGRAGTSCG